MEPGEAASYGPLMHQLYTALKPLVDAERIYHVVLLEGQPHFHTWLVPRPENHPKRGIAFLADDNQSCDENEVQQLAQALREKLSHINE
jgi:hypothetical protein